MNDALIGDTASENTEFNPIISAPHRFQIGMVMARPGNGPAYHTHDYGEKPIERRGMPPARPARSRQEALRIRGEPPV